MTSTTDEHDHGDRRGHVRSPRRRAHIEVIAAVMAGVIVVGVIDGVMLGVIDVSMSMSPDMSEPGGKSALYCWMTASVRSRLLGTHTTPPSLRSTMSV